MLNFNTYISLFYNRLIHLQIVTELLQLSKYSGA